MFAENLDTFLADFGEEVFIGATAVRAIFEPAYQSVLGDVAASVQPVLTIKESDIGTWTYGMTCTVRGTPYRITALEPDGTGMALARLEQT
jgi:hypothetical protein